MSKVTERQMIRFLLGRLRHLRERYECLGVDLAKYDTAAKEKK